MGAVDTKIAEPRTGPERKMIVPCDCVSTCECLFVSEWDEAEGVPGWQSFEFYSSVREDGWRQRFRAAWWTLRGKGAYYHALVTTPEQGRELGEWLLSKTHGRES
jgi:hypothetical protein